MQVLRASDAQRMYEEEVPSTMPAGPFLAPSTPVVVQNRFAPLIAAGGPPPSRRLVLVGAQEDDVAMVSDTETLVSDEPEADVNHEPVTSSQDESQAEAEGILQQIDSTEGEVVVPVVRRNRAMY